MKRRLLVHVDDDPDLAFLLERGLSVSGISNWSFQFIEGGAAALDYLERVKAGEAESKRLRRVAVGESKPAWHSRDHAQFL
jgi:hypothetical protein